MQLHARALGHFHISRLPRCRCSLRLAKIVYVSDNAKGKGITTLLTCVPRLPPLLHRREGRLVMVNSETFETALIFSAIVCLPLSVASRLLKYTIERRVYQSPNHAKKEAGGLTFAEREINPNICKLVGPDCVCDEASRSANAMREGE
jgi:hypothetical protein